MHQFGSQEPLILLLFKADAVLFKKEQQPGWLYQNKDWKSTALTDTGVLSGSYIVSFVNTVNLLVKNNKTK